MKTLNQIPALLAAIIVPFIQVKPVHHETDELPGSAEQPTDHLSIITGKLISVYLTAAELLLIIYK